MEIFISHGYTEAASFSTPRAKMAEEATDNTSSGGSRRQKLTGFANWPRWADLTKAMLIEKDV